jgi:SAM-dependent methyltransferase
MGFLKRAARRYLPSGVLAAYRRSRIEIPIRLRDALPDLAERIRGPISRLPPARLRRRVGRTSGRREYEEAGALAAAEILGAYQAAKAATGARWLDFGCGPGRIARHLVRLRCCERLVGADVDPRLVAWARQHVPGARFELIEPAPPTAFAPREFDLVYAASVFTHFSEAEQGLWLAELARILVPGGLLIASTHSERLADSRPDLPARELERLARDGFAFAAGRGQVPDRR